MSPRFNEGLLYTSGRQYDYIIVFESICVPNLVKLRLDRHCLRRNIADSKFLNLYLSPLVTGGLLYMSAL